MLLCELVLIDERTRKASAIGITHTVTLDRLATGHGPMFVYAAMTDGQGEYDLRIELMKLGDLEVRGTVARTRARLHDRNAIGELTVELEALGVDRPGHYALHLYADSAIIGGVSFAVVQSPDGEGADVGT